MIIVSGNRSGDLDSLISSYVKSRLLNIKWGREIARPLVYFEKQDWLLHRDVQFLLQSCQIDIEQYVSLSILEAMDKEEQLKIYLTDHNYPEQELLPFSSQIIQIIDHHEDRERTFQPESLIIDNTGSCSTLIAEEFLQLLRETRDAFSKETVKALAELLYFTIRIDTDKLPRTDQYHFLRDERALQNLLPYVKKGESFLWTLKAQKDNSEGFTLRHFLEKDYKVWQRDSLSYGMSSIHCPIDKFHHLLINDRPAVESFMKKKKIDLLFLIQFSNIPILKRELTVIPSKTFGWEKELRVKLLESGQFSHKEKNDELKYFHYDQLDPHFSRKKIQPLVDDILKTIIKDN